MFLGDGNPAGSKSELSAVWPDTCATGAQSQLNVQALIGEPGSRMRHLSSSKNSLRRRGLTQVSAAALRRRYTLDDDAELPRHSAKVLSR